MCVGWFVSKCLQHKLCSECIWLPTMGVPAWMWCKQTYIFKSFLSYLQLALPFQKWLCVGFSFISKLCTDLITFVLPSTDSCKIHLCQILVPEHTSCVKVKWHPGKKSQWVRASHCNIAKYKSEQSNVPYLSRHLLRHKMHQRAEECFMFDNLKVSWNSWPTCSSACHSSVWGLACKHYLQGNITVCKRCNMQQHNRQWQCFFFFGSSRLAACYCFF